MFRNHSTIPTGGGLAIFVLTVLLAIAPPSGPRAQDVWEELLADLAADGIITKGALAIHEGLFLAKSFDFNLTSDEARGIVEALADPAMARAQGVSVEGSFFRVVDVDAERLYARFGSGGLVAVRTERVVVIGLHDGSSVPSSAQQAAQNIADVIRSMGY